MFWSSWYQLIFLMTHFLFSFSKNLFFFLRLPFSSSNALRLVLSSSHSLLCMPLTVWQNNFSAQRSRKTIPSYVRLFFSFLLLFFLSPLFVRFLTSLISFFANSLKVKRSSPSPSVKSGLYFPFLQFLSDFSVTILIKLPEFLGHLSWKSILLEAVWKIFFFSLYFHHAFKSIRLTFF